MVKGKRETLTVIGAADFSASASLYLIINAAGAIATNDNDALGVLETHGIVGDHLTLAWSGHMKGRAGGVIAAGVPLMMGAGGTMVAATGATKPSLGKSLVAAASGDIFEFVGNFATTRVLA